MWCTKFHSFRERANLPLPLLFLPSREQRHRSKKKSHSKRTKNAKFLFMQARPNSANKHKKASVQCSFWQKEGLFQEKRNYFKALFSGVLLERKQFIFCGKERGKQNLTTMCHGHVTLWELIWFNFDSKTKNPVRAESKTHADHSRTQHQEQNKSTTVFAFSAHFIFGPAVSHLLIFNRNNRHLRVRTRPCRLHRDHHLRDRRSSREASLTRSSKASRAGHPESTKRVGSTTNVAV